MYLVDDFLYDPCWRKVNKMRCGKITKRKNYNIDYRGLDNMGYGPMKSGGTTKRSSNSAREYDSQETDAGWWFAEVQCVE